MKYVVSMREPKSLELMLEARNIREASEIIKRRYPNHMGYSIEKA